MFIFRHGGRRTAQIVLRQHLWIRRSYASRIEIPKQNTPFPVVEGCPIPTCRCREMPEGLDIERDQNIKGSMAAYAEQVLVSTGVTDWKSRIEQDDEAALIKQLKTFLTRGGKYSDVSYRVLNFAGRQTLTIKPAISQCHAYKLLFHAHHLKNRQRPIRSITKVYENIRIGLSTTILPICPDHPNWLFQR